MTTTEGADICKVCSRPFCLAHNRTPSSPETAGEAVADKASLKPFITEMLMHRGENPYQVKRGGYELWEAYIPSVQAALRYLPLYRHPVAADREASLNEAADWVEGWGNKFGHSERVFGYHAGRNIASALRSLALSPKGAGEATKPTQAEQLMRPQSGGVSVKPEGQLYNASDQGGER